MDDGLVTAVSRNETYSFSKPQRDEIVLVAGFGIEGDTHAGVKVRHRHRVRLDPTQPNLRQVHLIQGELFDEVRSAGHEVEPGQLGENVTTRGIDLLGLPRGTILRFGPRRSADGEPVDRAVDAAVAPVVAAARSATLDEATAGAVAALVAAAERETGGGTAVVLMGLRNPCQQINNFQSGLLKQVIGRDSDGTVIRKGGVMAVVLSGGPIRPGDSVSVGLPPLPHQPLECV